MGSSNYVILAYKGKLLLFSHDIDIDDITQNVWSFVGNRQLPKETSEDAIYRIIKHTTNLTLKNIKPILSNSQDKIMDRFYSVRLTDDDVNQIDRRSRQRLEFFKLKETEKLTLNDSTKYFLAKNRDEIKKLLV